MSIEDKVKELNILFEDLSKFKNNIKIYNETNNIINKELENINKDIEKLNTDNNDTIDISFEDALDNINNLESIILGSDIDLDNYILLCKNINTCISLLSNNKIEIATL